MVSAPVRFGIVGLGGMGRSHARQLQKYATTGGDLLQLTAGADPEPTCRELFTREAPNAAVFSSYAEMLTSGLMDVVLIATPHLFHADNAVRAFEAGLHVLCEKPLAVDVASSDRARAAAAASGKAFGVMFQFRTSPTSQALKQFVESGRLGRPLRIACTRTDWFRPDAYYASGSWRATWAGEGGGVLMNQAPHDLDLLCWLMGPPTRVLALCRTLRHQLEVEDFAAGVIEFASGAIGILQATTGELPGRNTLEIVGDRGTLMLDGGRLSFRLVVDESGQPTDAATIIHTATERFPRLAESTPQELPLPEGGGQHIDMCINFARHLLEGVPLIAPADGAHFATELANAFYLSSASAQPVLLPVDREQATAFFRQRGTMV